MQNSLSIEQIRKQFLKMHPGSVVTSGHYEIEPYCNVQDLEWNQMDQEHRPYIHATYTSAVRFWTTESSQFSLSTLSLFGIKFYVTVTDFRPEPGLYYQSFSLFNVFYIHAVTKCLPNSMYGEWHIFSHWLFKPFHFFIDRKMKKMNEIQNPEDVPVRKARTALREKGYRFAYDTNLNFITCNTKTNNVVFPPLNESAVFALSSYKADRFSLEKGKLTLEVSRVAPKKYLIWHGVCPHEGAPMSEAKLCDGYAVCRWHGLKFKGQEINPGEEKTLFNVKVRLDESEVLHLNGI